MISWLDWPPQEIPQVCQSPFFEQGDSLLLAPGQLQLLLGHLDFQGGARSDSHPVFSIGEVFLGYLNQVFLDSCLLVQGVQLQVELPRRSRPLEIVPM